MTFAIATNTETPAVTPREYDGNISFASHPDRAERKHRQIIAQIEACETPQEVKDTMIEHDLVLDALMVDFPDYYTLVSEAADDAQAILANAGPDGGAAPSTPTTAHNNVLGKSF